MTTVVSATPTGDEYIDGVLYGTQWGGPITYSFADNISDFGPSYSHTIGGFQQISATQQNAIQSILEGNVASGTALFTYGSFEQVANLDISLAADPFGASDVTIAQTNTFDGSNLSTARVADFPELDQRSSGGDVWFGDDYASYRTPEVGTYSWMTHIHELGHAVGLSHGHNAGTSIPGFQFAIPHDRDSTEFSVMSYRAYIGDPLFGGSSNETYGYSQTLMMYDIAALQHLYGADFTTNSSDTVYTWSGTTGEMFVNGVGQGAPGGGIGGAANRVYLTIWDGEGRDTYDFSTYTENSFIDLAPGAWSLVSQVQRANLGEGAYANGNVYNALQYDGDVRSLIENAEGGSANDDIGGNAAANELSGNDGNDILVGQAGSDNLLGGAGTDTLYGDFRTPAVNYSGTGLFTENQDPTNSTRETARDITAAIGYRADVDIEHSDVNPSVKISATGDGSFDWFAFNVTRAGQITLDIDGSMDSFIELYDATGTRIAFNEDSSTDAGDSTTQNVDWKSFISYTVTTPGTYFVKVGVYSGVGSGGPPGAVIPVGTAYTLGIVLPLPVDSTTAGFGNDTLNGGSGADVMFGGAGNDIYVVDDAGDVVTETTGAGIDEIRSSVTRTLSVNVEKLTLLGSANINGSGNTLGNLLVGNAGANILDGKAGADTLQGLGGNDIYQVDNASDEVFEAGGQGSDTVQTTVSYTLAAGQEIETLRLLGSTGSTALNLTGNEFVNTLIGNAGANILDGKAGADTLQGLGGNDIYQIDNAGDIVMESAGQGADTVQTAVSYTLAAGQEIETLRLLGSTGSTALNLTGNTFGQTLIGNAGANILDGKAGADTLQGLGGNDVYQIDNIGDTVLELIGQGADTVQTAVSYALAIGQEIETLRLLASTGSAALNLTGNAFGQSLIGNTGANTLNGGRGKDTLIGGQGDDTYFFNTTLDAATNDDTIVGFSGVAGNNDTIALRQTIFANLSAGSLNAANFIATSTGAAQDANDFIVYDLRDGALIYDTNGSASGGDIVFARLSGIPTLTAADFVIV
ncbi:M10 family metallopeptidase C-terminal domain-containing protein [Pararhizobium gei]|uniref:M10 family metallopeptidase C-terminal domain-containing protein n=1 Tax=Pararhizobium gei TaxID=1395951 RepID=UPI0023DA8607|nr:pre-peptidase C-terminal domain-containing protein [Rhizobium gei]